MNLRVWVWLHKWTSLVSMLFLLMLCVTGLPLIFHEEIDHLTHEVVLPELPSDQTKNLDEIMAAAQQRQPDQVIRFAAWDQQEHPHQIFFTMTLPDQKVADGYSMVVVDDRTAQVLGTDKPGENFMALLLEFHINMFLGLPGQLFLGLMGLLLVLAVISGIVLYRPFMKRLDFGALRRDKGGRSIWLDSHNLLGVVTLAWVLVVGLTGTINTLAPIVVGIWSNGQLASMVQHKAHLPPIEKLGSLQVAVDRALQTIPGREVSFIAFPGTDFSSSRDYNVFIKGDTPLSSRLIQPVLVDAETGELTATAKMPWYVTSLLVSQPLHFGDYGGLPLKIIWALLDIITIIVLWSGLVLWWQKRRQPQRNEPLLEEGA